MAARTGEGDGQRPSWGEFQCANLRRRFSHSSTKLRTSSTDPAIILSSASVAVLGSCIPPCGTRTSGVVEAAGRLTGPLAASWVCEALASRRPRVGMTFCRSPKTFSKSHPAGRLSGSSATLRCAPSGRLGVLSMAIRLVSRVTSWCSRPSVRMRLSASSGVVCRKVRPISASVILRRAQSFEGPGLRLPWRSAA